MTRAAWLFRPRPLSCGRGQARRNRRRGGEGTDLAALKRLIIEKDRGQTPSSWKRRCRCSSMRARWCATGR